jgi:hypothetical protein
VTAEAPIPDLAHLPGQSPRDSRVGRLLLSPHRPFRVLFIFVVLAHRRRRVLHFNVTEHPSTLGAAHQIVEAFPGDSVPRYLLRDRDRIYGAQLRRRISGLGIEQVLSTDLAIRPLVGSRFV